VIFTVTFRRKYHGNHICLVNSYNYKNGISDQEKCTKYCQIGNPLMVLPWYVLHQWRMSIPKSKSKLYYDRWSAGQSVLEQSNLLGLTTRSLLLSDSCGFRWFGTPSLMRGRVCRLQLLLALASAVIFGSESCRTHDHILLSQIRDFPFRRLLLLAGSQWRYSTPPPHGL
jgi:hypothetical protein